MDKDEALKLGLQLVATAEYLATDAEICGKDAKEERALIQRSKIAFEEALAQPETEPKKIPESWATHGGLWIESLYKHQSEDDNKYLYTAPPQRTWVGLTEEDKNNCLVSADPCECLAKPESHQLIEDVEAKLREKNTYTTSPQREWVGLTEPEVDEAYKSVSNKEWAIGGLDDARVFFCAIEAKLREKNTC